MDANKMNTQKENAIRVCYAKILLQDRLISYDDAMIKATKWYEEKIEAEVAAEEFRKNFIGPKRKPMTIEELMGD